MSPRNSASLQRPRAGRPLPLAALALAGVCACSGVTDLIANLDTVTYKSALFAINGTPLGAPTAINTALGATVRAEALYDFDVAFDLDAGGHAVLYTQRRVGLPIGTAGRQVGLQPMTEAFAAVTEAPKTGWVVDSTLTVSVGQVIALRTATPVCQFELSPYLYSKMMVDSVDVAQRRIWVTTLTDPNCGFRDLVPGRPKH